MYIADSSVTGLGRFRIFRPKPAPSLPLDKVPSDNVSRSLRISPVMIGAGVGVLALILLTSKR